MKTNVIETDKWGRELEVEVSAERLNAEFNKAYRKYQKDLTVPGFRKGKVPLKIIERRFGASIRSEVLGDLLPAFLDEAAREADLHMAAPPKIAKLDHEPDGPLTFTAEVAIWPQIEVEHFEGLQAESLSHTIEDEEIETQLKELQTRQATEESVERPLEKGDVLIADLQRLDESGVPIIGESFEERYFIIGDENAPSPEFEETLIGIAPGEERQVHFAYRDDLPNEEMAGKQEHFAVTAREVRQRVLPVLDDEFAKDLGGKFHSLEDLRQDISDQIKQRWDYLGKQKLRGDLISELISKNEFEVPASMVTHYLDSTKGDRDQAQSHDHSHDHDHDDDHDHSHDQKYSEEELNEATRRIKTFILIEGLRKQQQIEVSDEGFDTFLQERADELGMKLEDIKRSSDALDNMRREQEENKVMDFLRERATIVEKSV